MQASARRKSESGGAAMNMPTLHEASAMQLSAKRGAGSSETRHFLWLLLATGGDERIWPDPVTRRSKYGTRTEPAPDELAFSSTTANTISEQGYAAAARALERLTSPDPKARFSYDEWFDEIRAQILGFLGVPGAEAILTPSGTDAEIMVAALAASITDRPLTNILIGPEETGSGAPLAASGRHFAERTALGSKVTPASVIAGLSDHPVDAMFVPIRHGNGSPCDTNAIGARVREAVERTLKQGRAALVHVLDSSKTGLCGVTREAARSLKAHDPERIFIVVDACQLRCSLSQIKRDLDDGFMVIATGSKFAGGPPFSGVVLLPAALAGEIRPEAPLARGLAGYSAVLDWPASLRSRLDQNSMQRMNTGLGLRWAAALDGLTAMAALGDEFFARFADRFAGEVIARARNLRRAQYHGDDAASTSGPRTIVPLTVLTENGSFANLVEGRAVASALRAPTPGSVCHVGQAVRLGPRSALRVAASAYTMAGVAARIRDGYCFERAFQPVIKDLDRLFEKWSLIERQPQKFGCPRE
jgi:hypothetical protein